MRVVVVLCAVSEVGISPLLESRQHHPKMDVITVKY